MTTATVSVPTGTWAVDAKHSSIEFRVEHLGISTVRGTFGDFEGTLEIGDDITSAKAYGKIKSSGNFTFMQIYQAGHMVPMDQPENSLDFFNRWLGGEWVN